MDFSRAARIYWLFPIGFFFPVVALATSVQPSTAKVVFLGFFCLFFGLLVLSPLNWLRLKPRIVPYFARQLEPYGGKSSVAFHRGRALCQQIAALDELARTVGVRTLSEFGFTDDYYNQEVRWHSAAEGLRTAEALEQAENANVTADLAALAAVLRIAAAQGVDFSLILRIGKDSLQAVSTMEGRQGRFW